MCWTLTEPLIALLLGLEADQLVVALLEFLLDVEHHALDLVVLDGLSL